MRAALGRSSLLRAATGCAAGTGAAAGSIAGTCGATTGAGGVSFCAGADLKAIETFAPRLDAPEGPMGFTRLTPGKPTIAAIDGWCLAGGLELALWCDLRIATTQSRLGFPERRWGVPLIDGGTQRLPRIVGLGRALDLTLTGRIVESDEALAMGLLTEVVEDGGPHVWLAGQGERRAVAGQLGAGRGGDPAGRGRANVAMRVRQQHRVDGAHIKGKVPVIERF